MMLTWIIEHLLLAFPAWFWFVFATVGAVVYFFSDVAYMLVPLVPYTKFVKATGGVMILIGVYLYGGAKVTDAWQQQVTEMQHKVATAEQASADANAQIQTLAQTKVKIIHDRQIIVQKKIIKDSEKMDASCVIDPVVIEDLNLAAGGKKK
jgi:hypothetical protein